MTIVAVGAAPDGIVLASDGRTTLRSGRRHRVASDHTRKVFSPVPGIGIATYGAAFVGDRTIAGLIEELAAARGEGSRNDVDSLAVHVTQFFSDKVEEASAAIGRAPAPGQLGFLVAGFDERGVGRVKEVLIPIPSVSPETEELTTSEPGALFRGQTGFIRRLLEGYDAGLLRRSQPQLLESAAQSLETLAYVVNEPISLQDALDIALFAVRLTIDMDRMTDGTVAEPEGIPSCGGDVRALLISRGRSEWILDPPVRPREAGRSEAG